jgi:isopentenyl diphosphate isomerase/L-lactate dehydrogenase-like FMN-dependent dehydrogenase
MAPARRIAGAATTFAVAVATALALHVPVVAAAGDLPVLFDSGVRSGADAVKALALGARAVLLARPWVYGLGLAGQAGVEHVLRCFLADLDLQLGLSGHRSAAELSPVSLIRP